MRFSEAEIDLARRLQRNGLTWEPKAGNYVYDETGFCKQASPFQERVYFILNYSYFMKTVGGVDRFKAIMTWLPTWNDAREILRSLHVSDQQILEYLTAEKAIENGMERFALYGLIDSTIGNQTAAV